MKFATRSLFVGAAFALAACGSDADAPEVTTELIAPGDDCAAGGTAVFIDGELSATVCNGTDGLDGRDGLGGATPQVSTERVESHADCDGGGVLLTVTVGQNAVESVLCDGEDGQEGEPGTGPAILIGAPANCVDGGYSLQVGDDDPIDICHGEDGEDGEPGVSPNITAEIIEPDEFGVCPYGGVELTITTEFGSENFVLCGGDVEVETPDVEISWCNTQGPETHTMSSEASGDFFAQVFVADYTDSGRLLPSSFAVQAGFGDVDSLPWDGDWDWFDGAENSVEGDNLEFVATASGLGSGFYDYLFRMREDDTANWVYCGLEGIVDQGDYDADLESGSLEVTAPAGVFVGWDYADQSLDATDGTGVATFFPGVDSAGDPLSDDQFFGSQSNRHWAANNWITTTNFFDSNGEVVRDRYFRFESNFDELSFVEMTLRVESSPSGPDRFQVAAEYADGSLQFLDDAVTFSGTTTLEAIALPFLNDAGDAPVAYRLYPYNASGDGGNFRSHFVEFLGQ